MKRNLPEITRYKIHKWYNSKKREITWGVDVIIEGESYHVKDDKKAIFFSDKSDAIKYVRGLNKELGR